MAQSLDGPGRVASPGDDSPWELFHENSKTGRYDGFPPLEYIRQLRESVWLKQIALAHEVEGEFRDRLELTSEDANDLNRIWGVHPEELPKRMCWESSGAKISSPPTSGR